MTADQILIALMSLPAPERRRVLATAQALTVATPWGRGVEDLVALHNLHWVYWKHLPEELRRYLPPPSPRPDPPEEP